MQGQGPYAKQLKQVELDIKAAQARVNEKMGKLHHSRLVATQSRASSELTRCSPTGVKESDTGLAPPNLWDLPADKQRMGEEHPLQVARCTKILRLPTGPDAPPLPVLPQGQKPNADEQDKYVINVKQIAKFVVGLGDRVAPTDIEEGMRVG